MRYWAWRHLRSAGGSYETVSLLHGQIPDAAVKCQHCGEWVDGRRSSQINLGPVDLGSESSLGDAANRYINYKIIMGVIGLIVFLLFFVCIWLPGFNSVQQHMQTYPSPNQFGLPPGTQFGPPTFHPAQAQPQP